MTRYNEKKDDLINNANRMDGGLKKLQDAAQTVDELTTNAVAKRKVCVCVRACVL